MAQTNEEEVMEYERKEIPLNLLEINTENPRFEMVGNQREAIRIMIEKQKNKLANLAQDIIEHGLNPSEDIIVIPSERNTKKYRILEGNRRVTALKLLQNPNLIPEKFKTLLNRFKKMISDYDKKPISEIRCVVFPGIEDASRWIKLKHTGENDGVGVVTWNAQQKRRFEERYEGSSSYALQVLNLLSEDEDIDSDLKKKLPEIPSSSLQRLLSDPDVRETIGLSVEDGRIMTQLPPNEIRKPLTKIITDLSRDDFTVKEIYYKDDRMNYLETFKRQELPDKSETIPKWEIITSHPPKGPIKKRKRSKALSLTRHTIIPKSLIIHIDSPRINKIYRELKDLDLRDFINAAAITLRVFFELSVDHYISKFPVPAGRDDKLFKKTIATADYMEKNNVLSKAKLKPIRTAVSNPDSIFSINTFNAYVHNPHFNPIESELKTAWDNVAEFVVKIWET